MHKIRNRDGGGKGEERPRHENEIERGSHKDRSPQNRDKEGSEERPVHKIYQTQRGGKGRGKRNKDLQR